MAAHKLFYAIFCVRLLHASVAVKLDVIDCGVDNVDEIAVGDIPITKYPWFGMLWYTDARMLDERAVTQVALIHAEFVLAAAHAIHLLPKDEFRKRSFVLLGEDWTSGRRGRRVRNYVIHPEYEQTHATLALVHLRDPLRLEKFRPLCPPPEVLPNPALFAIRFKSDYDNLQKEVIPMYYVPPRLCKDFYVQANLYEEMMRPPHVVCACSIEHENVCVWDWSTALVMKDVWGRWVLLGMSVYGPGCSGPTRFLDMLSYYPWIIYSLDKFRMLTISKIHPHKFVLRTGITSYEKLGYGIRKLVQRYGECDAEERKGRLYREVVILKTDHSQYQFFAYNMSLTEAMDVTCMMIELINASADSDMTVHHLCPRLGYGPRCYDYEYSQFVISVNVMFSGSCMFELNLFGEEKSMKLLDITAWHWEEGTYYEDFAAARVEYLGPHTESGFGIIPAPDATYTAAAGAVGAAATGGGAGAGSVGQATNWLPDYDVFSSTTVKKSTPPTRKYPNLYWAEMIPVYGFELPGLYKPPWPLVSLIPPILYPRYKAGFWPRWHNPDTFRTIKKFRRAQWK